MIRSIIATATLVFCITTWAQAAAETKVWDWNFNNQSRDTVADSDGKLHGNLQGEHRWVASPMGGAIEFNGITGHLQLEGEGHHTIAANEGLTLRAAVRIVKSGDTQLIVFAAPTLELEIRGENGVASFNLVGANGQSTRCTGNTAISDGRWHQIVGVRDPQTKTVRLYIDGHLDQEVEDATAGSSLPIPKAAIIGGKSGEREMLGGAIDHIQMMRGVGIVKPQVAASANEREQRTWTLANDLTEMRFVARDGTLTLESLIDKTTNTQFIESAVASPNNLWQVALRSPRWSAILDETQGKLSAKQTDTQIVFTWSDIPLGEDDAAVTVTVDLPEDSAMSQWKMDIDHSSDSFGVWTAQCPRINNLRKLADDPMDNFVAIPGGNGGGAGEGQLHEDPWNTMHPVIRTYPCYYQSMQFNAWYGPDAGLYLATYDGDMHLKGFFIKPAATHDGTPIMTYDLIHYPADAGVEGAKFSQAYPAIVGVFHGDWYDAARIYRDWAMEQVWCRLGPTHQREDISPWLRQGAWWVMFPLDREDDDRPLLRKKARTLPFDEVQRLARHVDVEKTLDKAKRAYEYFGFPMILWSNEWFDGGGDTSPPRYIPVNNLDQFLARLHESVPEAYFSAHIQPKRYSQQVAEYNDEVEWALEHTPEGLDAVEPPNPGETYDVHAYPCWATDFWQKDWYDRSKQRASIGLDGYHIDELGSSTSFAAQCFNREHGHPVGGGTLYAETRRNMTTLIRDAARSERPHFAAHHEVLCEIYIDVADAAEVCTAPNNRNIPMWEAVYHDYNFVMGRRIIEWTDRNLFPLGDRDGDELIDEFVSSYGQTYIWGNQPSWTRVDIIDYAPRIAAFIKDTMESRYRALDYLNFGDMMRPLVVTQPLEKVKRIWRMTDTPEHTLPVVLNSVWKAPDGTIGIVLFNITDQPQSISYQSDLEECGLSGTHYKVTRIDGPESIAMEGGSMPLLERTDTIEPYNVMILKVESGAE